jgi:hypothetical protein
MLDTSKIYNSINSGEFRVVNYINAKTVDIEFIETGYKATVNSNNIILGRVKDRMHPRLYGVGFIGCGDIKTSDKNGRMTKAYQAWKLMLERCYCKTKQKTNPTYIDCSVDKEWHNFQVFASWHKANYIKGFSLDKDIKVDGNRIYSKDTCQFTSSQVNNEKAQAKNYKFINPYGELIRIYNLAKFCRENGLHQGHMSQVHASKFDSHKGWIKG